MSKWIRRGDKVVVIAGNEKGQTGTVLNRSGHRVVIEGLNIRKKHIRPKSRASQGIVEMETPMHISNVSLCNEKGTAIKVKVKQTKSGKQLIYLEADKEVVYRDATKSK